MQQQEMFANLFSIRIPVELRSETTVKFPEQFFPSTWVQAEETYMPSLKFYQST